jgi:aspartyl-tRNA(Asn)/glutamyl-tRNA(Gln) amidotransferase subunit A
LLKRAGARLTDETLSQFDGMAQVNSKGGVQPAEAFAVHRDLLSRRADAIDPNVRVRLERARNASAADYIDMVRDRTRLIGSMDARLADLDVLVSPTTPIVAPTMAEVTPADEFARKNAMLLRNTVVANFFDLCAISLPVPREGALPTGLMLVARNGNDHRLFRIAAAVERLFAA